LVLVDMLSAREGEEVSLPVEHFMSGGCADQCQVSFLYFPKEEVVDVFNVVGSVTLTEAFFIWHAAQANDP